MSSTRWIFEIVGKLLEEVADLTISSLGGSSFSETFKLTTKKKSYFLKTFRDPTHFSLLKTEADMLKYLQGKSSIPIPYVIATGNSPQPFLLMEFIETGMPTLASWTLLGKGLAEIHQHKNDRFGFEYSTPCGSILENNSYKNNWTEFFILNRIQPHIRFAVDHQLFDTNDYLNYQRFEKWFQVDDRFPPEPPTLIHGDLWSGNVLFQTSGKPFFIDPALYYGHREIDLGMSRLFGGFSETFYHTYQAYYPLEPGFKERIPLSQLYHILLHMRLFGGSYVRQARQILNYYS